MIDKSDDPDPVIAGQNMTYKLVVTNNGPAQATGVQVIDSLPTGVSFINASSTQGGCSAGVHCLIGDMGVTDVVTITINVNVDSDQTTGLSNFAFVSSLNPDTIPSNNDDTELTTVNLFADLKGVKTSTPEIATPGSSLSYEIVVTNLGPSLAQNVHMADYLPIELENGTAQSSQGTCRVTGPFVECNLGDIAAGAEAFLTVVGTVSSSATGTLTNRLRVTCQPYEEPYEPEYPTCPNNIQDLDTPVSANADLSIVKGVSSTLVTAGETFTYTITVNNAGPSLAQNVIVTDTLDSGVDYVSATPTPSSQPDPVIWNIGDLDAGESQVIELVVQAQPDLFNGRTIYNTVVVGSDTEESNLSNNSDDAQNQVQAESQIVVEKTASSDPVSYTHLTLPTSDLV